MNVKQIKGYQRNLSCWCGSGKKYKKCHLNREVQQRPSPWNHETSLRKLFAAKGCLHPQASESTCVGAIVNGHTVRRSADLKAIARQGHVYQGYADVASLNRTGGVFLPKLVGINQASTFTGFCQGHDTSAFAPLENDLFEPTTEQAFLLAYRPLLKELYLKQRHLESLALVRETDKGTPLSHQLETQQIVRLMEAGVVKALSDIGRHKRSFDNDFMANDYSNIRHVVFDLDRSPDIVCSGVFQPTVSFSGRLIQDTGDLFTDLDFASFSLLANAGSGAAVFAWRADSDRASSILVDSLLALPSADIPNALVRFVFTTLENAFWRPEWWEGLSDELRQSAIARINYGISLGSRLTRRDLTNDGRRFVDWVVVGARSTR